MECGLEGEAMSGAEMKLGPGDGVPCGGHGHEEGCGGHHEHQQYITNSLPHIVKLCIHII